MALLRVELHPMDIPFLNGTSEAISIVGRGNDILFVSALHEVAMAEIELSILCNSAQHRDIFLNRYRVPTHMRNLEVGIIHLSRIESDRFSLQPS